MVKNLRDTFLLVDREIWSLPDYEMGSHGKGSAGRCSEREENRLLDTCLVICIYLLHLHLCVLHIFDFNTTVLLTPNQINSAGDTLLLSPPEFFHAADLLCDYKGSVITGAGEITRAGDERWGRNKRMSPQLLNQKWVRGVNEHEAHWCETAS